LAFNTTAAQPSPLSVFGGWVNEMAAVALPEGTSPDCVDVGFLPGSVYSRPGLNRIFNPPIDPGISCVYAKSFTTPTGVIKNLYLFADGNLYVEDVTNSPNTATLALTTTPNSVCQSITAFGREWIAFSDGLHGTDIPYQYDGTFFDRVTQDGPGAPPSVTCITLPPSALATSSVPVSTAITSIATSNPQIIGGIAVYTALALQVASTAGFSVGMWVTIAGATGLNGSYSVVQIVDTVHLILGLQSGTSTFATATGGNLTGTAAGTTLIRSANTVSANTSPVHNLQVGFRVQISGMTAAALGGGITNIAINNEDNPGQATVTTSTPHGLSPGLDVTITGVSPQTVGSTLSSATQSSGETTLTFSTPHNLVPGAVIVVSGVTTSTGTTTFSFNGNFTVALVPSPLTVQYAQVPNTATDPDVIQGTGGAVSISWPVPDNTPTPTYFEVLTCPTATTFTVQVTYQDGVWSNGTVAFAWDGIFYVTAVPSTTSFQYLQYGPNISTTQPGTVTPYGQMAPGTHLCQVLFLTRQGDITEPSPPVRFISNGQQYVNVQNIPFGPPNVVARILAFTGAQPNVPGELPPFFYIPVTPQLAGLTVGTSTQIDDNVATNVLLDFSDNTLYAATAISVLGNRLADQIVIDGALGFSYWQSRVTTFGQRNRIQNMLNLSFNGGSIQPILHGAPPVNYPFFPPLGWQQQSSPGYTEGVNKAPGWRFRFITPSTAITQSMYQDSYGVPIADTNKTYSVYFFAYAVKQNGNESITFSISSASASFSTSVTVAAAQLPGTAGGWVNATFPNPTPSPIPTDMIFSISAANVSNTDYIAIQDLSIIDSAQPYLDTQSFTSYSSNPAAFDGVTGNMQPSDDTRKLMAFSVIRGTPYCLTQAPSGRLHEIIVNPTSEPSGWAWSEVAADCGVLSAFGITSSQSDDASASGGEGWFAWAAETGVMIFDGGIPEKISQEIQQAWNGAQLPDSTWPQINMPYAYSITAMNDPVERIMYFFVPLGLATQPNRVYVLYYKELNTARAIMGSPPFHPSLGGKLIATDNTRKWTRWTMNMFGASRMYRQPGVLTTVFYGGGHGNVYYLSAAKFTDDDFGQIYPYYTTHFFLDPEKAMGMNLSSVRLMLAYLNAYISGTGTVTYSFLVDSLANVWPLNSSRTLSSTPTFDQENAGGNAQGNRIAVKISVLPLQGQTDVQFSLKRLQTWWRKARLVIRGAA